MAEKLTDEQVQQEIERLNKSEYVKLSQKEISMRYKRRQRLYQLRNHEKRGKALAEAGITMELLDQMDDEQLMEVKELCKSERNRI